MSEVSRNESADAAGLRALLNRLTAFKVLVWGRDSQAPDTSAPRDEVTDLGQAQVVSSLHRPELHETGARDRHALVLDIDHPAWLVKSSTPGHFHLYVDVPGGIPHQDYMDLLGALATARVIETGYAGASASRGHSDVRLPWIKKGTS